MSLSVFDLFKIGIGPSSSHTVGPMLAAVRFARGLAAAGLLDQVASVRCDLYGSLALTGRGHATDLAIILGLSGEQPDLVDPDLVPIIRDGVAKSQSLRLNGAKLIRFVESEHLVFHMDEVLPGHPNGLRLTVFDVNGQPLRSEVYYSVGGGFVVKEGETATNGDNAGPKLPYPFATASELLAYGQRDGLTIAEVMAANELTFRPASETNARLDRIWEVMNDCIERGCATDGILPGGLGVRRRARAMRLSLERRPISDDPLSLMDWVSVFALAVNEENAAGGRVVTAPTNGAAGVIPAVIAYYRRFFPKADQAGVRTFLLTAAAIGMLYKRNASLSAAEMGCQGEVGVACSMAAAGLAAVMGGTNRQIENAAEIGMEHNLGLTCDPVGGLVQVPCIERNTMGAMKAINAARLAVLHGDGSHKVPLDRVIETMRQTGVDMQVKYKETSRGGLAVNLVDC